MFFQQLYDPERLKISQMVLKIKILAPHLHQNIG
jgi:hypothetical protein